MMSQSQKAINQYRQSDVEAPLFDSDPHAIIQQLMKGVLDCIASAKGAIQRNDAALKARRITHAVRILDGLRAHLDHEKGGEIAQNLDALYDYIGARLIHANAHNDATALDEAARLMLEIKTAWDAIRPANKEAVAS